MKKILLALSLLFVPLTASASLVGFYQQQGQSLPSVAQRAPVAQLCGVVRNPWDYRGTASQNSYLESCLRSRTGVGGLMIGATIARPELFYSSNLTRGLAVGGSETVIYVATLPTETTGYMVINPLSASVRELIKYTGVTTTGGNQLTGVTRGLAEAGTTGVAISDSRVAANAKRHSSGETISMNNGRYEQNIIDQLNGLTTSSIKATDQNFTVSSTLYFIGTSVAIRNNGGVLQWSIDGFANSYNFTSSSISQLQASSTLGIQVVNSLIGVNASTTQGMAFGVDGKLYQKTSSTLGVYADSNGISINTSTLSALFTSFSGASTSTPTANKIPISDSNGSLGKWVSPNAIVAGETINVTTNPVPVFISSTGQFYRSDADATSTGAVKFYGFTTQTSTSGSAYDLVSSGVVSGFTGLATGTKYYVSNTVGTITSTPGQTTITVGLAISQTKLLIQRERSFAIGSVSVGGATIVTTTLGFRPTLIKINAEYNSGGAYVYWSNGVATPNSQSSIYWNSSDANRAGADNSENSALSANVIQIDQAGTATFFENGFVITFGGATSGHFTYEVWE